MSNRKSQRLRVLEDNPGRRALPNEPQPRPVISPKSPYKLGHFGLKFYRVGLRTAVTGGSARTQHIGVGFQSLELESASHYL